MHMFLFYLLTTIVAQHALALRCKCTTSKGVSKCNGDFCDVHGTSDKRAACGAVRVARQTHFACVHIKHTSNDTFCHVIKSATACWCRVVDFCNVDLEAELFDVDADEDERQQQRSEEDYFEEEISHDTFIITATRLDDMKSVELETVTRLSANDHLQLMPDTRTVAPSFLPDDYFDNYGEELDEEGNDYGWSTADERPAHGASASGRRQEAATSIGWQRKQIETANENQQSAIIPGTATAQESTTSSLTTRSTLPARTTATIPSLRASRPSTTTQPTTTTTATTSTITGSTTTAAASSKATSEATTTSRSNSSSTSVTQQTIAADSTPLTTTLGKTTKTAVTTITTTTTPPTRKAITSNENPEEQSDYFSEESSLPDLRPVPVAMPTAIEKVRDGLGVSLNRRANAPLSGRWDAMELGTAAAVPERGSPSPTRVYAQLVPRTVLDKWATYRHHYLNIVSASTATNAHTPLCFGLLAQMLFSLLTA